MDVKTAFSNGDLNEEIYMEQPEGFSTLGLERKASRLVRSLYGYMVYNNHQNNGMRNLRVPCCHVDLRLTSVTSVFMSSTLTKGMPFCVYVK